MEKDINKEVETIVEDVSTNATSLTKEEVTSIVNEKVASLFGDILKELNKPKEVVKEVKEKTIEDYRF